MNRISSLVLVVVSLMGCVAPVREPPRQLSQLQYRQLQTRVFENETVVNGMKAVSSALQDEGYTLNQANTELGLITANRVINDMDTKTRDGQVFWMGFAKDYRAARRWEATANVQRISSKLRIRISIIEKELNESGGVIYSQIVAEPGFYQNLFSKIDKSVFLQRNNL